MNGSIIVCEICDLCACNVGLEEKKPCHPEKVDSASYALLEMPTETREGHVSLLYQKGAHSEEVEVTKDYFNTYSSTCPNRNWYIELPK